MTESSPDKAVEDCKRKEVLQAKIRQRVACEERAFRIVEKLVENTVTEDYFKDVAAYIDQANYEDIVEERSIAKTCGYPICNNALTKVLGQKYRICTKTNKVYDISDRKRYCSTKCYKASNYYVNQVPDSPVWTRKHQRPPQIQLLARKERHDLGNDLGECVLQHPSSVIKEQLDELQKIDQVTAQDQDETKPTVQPTNDNGCNNPELPVLFPTDCVDCVQNNDPIEKEETESKPDNDKVLDLDTDDTMYGIQQKQQAITASLHKDHVIQDLQQTPEDILYQPYCQRDLRNQSQGYVNRATYYGYDQKQQALKAELCKQIVQRDVHATVRCVKDSAIGQDITHRGQRGHTGLYGVEQKTQAQQAAKNKNKTISFINSHHSNSYSGNVGEQTHKSESESGAKNNQQKIDNLMTLLDKRDSLKQQLKTSTTSVSKGHTPVAPLMHTSPSESSGHTPVVQSRSSQVLENIKRATTQQYGGSTGVGVTTGQRMMDSDDEEELDDVENTGSSSNITSQMDRLSMADTTDKLTPFTLISKVLLEWRTEETVNYLKGEKSSYKGGSTSQYQHTELSKKIDAQIRQYAHLLDDPSDHSSHDHPARPVPDYSQLQNDPYSLKVEEFYMGGAKKKKAGTSSDGQVNIDLLERSHVTEEKKKKKLFDLEIEEESPYDRRELLTEKDVCLPYIDSKSQISLRRKIVLDKLTRVLDDLLGPLQLSIRDISADLRATVYTFNLTKDNIVLQPSEWTLMGFCMLKMLSVKVRSVRVAMRHDYPAHLFNTILLSSGVTSVQIQQLMERLLG